MRLQGSSFIDMRERRVGNASVRPIVLSVASFTAASEFTAQTETSTARSAIGALSMNAFGKTEAEVAPCNMKKFYRVKLNRRSFVHKFGIGARKASVSCCHINS
jgi:hypothetical protein